MPNDPSHYHWLDACAPLPRIVVEARKLLGTEELTDRRDNHVIMGWADELGGKIERDYTADAIPWCGLFMAIVAKRAGKTPPIDPLWALNWGKFGEPAGQPALGDILTFMRPLKGGGVAGHVAIYIAEDAATYHVLGGNQSDMVCYANMAKDRLRAARRPPYMNQPPSVRPYVVASTGIPSSEED